MPPMTDYKARKKLYDIRITQREDRGDKETFRVSMFHVKHFSYGMRATLGATYDSGGVHVSTLCVEMMCWGQAILLATR